ncbi:hypothetical protein NPIL_689971 [Nephila pilipes]|uniref:Uncharacterized protein n=1 Tax=Nephila pilipes TaxID=299642 RepID=A0A8X6MW08_NEPPI|nr:hypothetical protein NPIL_689971 [Nephila pilipes]
MATEIECNNSRPLSPSLTQDKETCETLRLMNERLRILKMQHEDAYSHVCHIESRYMDRESDFYKGAYGLYLTAKEAAEEAESGAGVDSCVNEMDCSDTEEDPPSLHIINSDEILQNL